MTSITQIDVGRDGSWTRIEDGCPSEGGEDSRNGIREIALSDDAEEYNQERIGRNDVVSSGLIITEDVSIPVALVP